MRISDWSSDVCSSDLPVGTEVESSLRAIGGLGYLEGSFLVVAGPALLGLAALQQGIALELLLDIGHQFQVGELQQLDSLLQLRRHNERLAMPEFKTGTESHD